MEKKSMDSEQQYYKMYKINDPKQVELIGKYPTYRRLCNIVNDYQNTNDLFRNNLIKELYFMLKLFPIINNQVKNIFLLKLEKWYNSNDHKKIEISSSGLQKMIKTFVTPKQVSYKMKRPKTGLHTNTIKNLLRPYTANNNNIQICQQNRPLSSKTANISTKIGSNQSQGYLNYQNYEIQQKLFDYQNKHRTLHPQYEPVEQRLNEIFNLLNAPQQRNKKKINKNKNKQRFSSKISSFNNQHFNSLKSVSQISEQQSYINSNDNIKQQEQDLYVPKYLNTNPKNKPYKKESFKTRHGHHNSMDFQYQPTQLKHYEAKSNNKKQLEEKQTKQIIRYRNLLLKQQSKIRKEISRKIQSLNTKMKQNRNKLKINNSKGQSKKQFLKIKNNEIELNEQNKQNIPKYNSKQFFKEKFKKKFNYSKRYFNSVQSIQYPIVKSAFVSCAQEQDKFNRFNPIDYQNIQNYNSKSIEDVSKIQQKINCTHQFNKALVKALYIDAYNNQNKLEFNNMKKQYTMLSLGKKQKIKKNKYSKKQN